MLINSKEYFKHSGVMGMKWGKSGSSSAVVRPEGGSAGGAGLTEEEADKLEEENGLIKTWGYDENGNQTGQSGYVDEFGNKYPRNLDDAIEAKRKHGNEMDDFNNRPKSTSQPIQRQSDSLYERLQGMSPLTKKARDKAFRKEVMKATIQDIKSIPSSAIKKGKAFVDSLFD